MSDTMTYVALRPCGCCVMATAARSPRAEREVAACVREGYEIRTVDAAWVREQSEWGCPVCKPPTPVQEALL